MKSEKSYGEILDILEKMKTGIVSDCTAQLMTTGIMPEDAQRELRVLSQITGAVFHGIVQVGGEVFEDEENSELVLVKIGGKKYSCAKVSLSQPVDVSVNPFASEEHAEASKEVGKAPSSEVSKAPSSEVSKAPSKESNVSKSSKKVVEEPDDEEAKEEISPGSLEQIDEEGDAFEKDEEDEESADDSPVPVPVTAKAPAGGKEALKASVAHTNDFDDDLVDDDDFESENNSSTSKGNDRDDEEDAQDDEEDAQDVIEDDDEDEVASAEEESTTRKDSEVESARSAAAAARAARENSFVEEAVKPIGEMVYNMSKLSVAHIGGGRPEEVVAMIAPLKISKCSSPAVPILVALFNRGKVVIKTSYDMGDGGKAIVTMEINDMHFLCRGQFDEEGKFKALITTTGISSQEGMSINVISSKNYGNGKDSKTKNGHVKIRYNDESGQGTIEVFPFGTEKDNEFIVFVKNPEFNDSYYISPHGRNGSLAKVQSKDGWLDVVPSWNGDVLEVEVFDS